MSITNEQLAELLAGIARSQQAIIDAIESETGGWRGTHLLPKLNTAANTRIANVRLLDLPSRILLRSQARVPMDVATIARELNLALGGAGEASAPAVSGAPIGSSATASAPAPAAAAVGVAAIAATAIAVGVTAAEPGALVAAPGDDEELNFFDS